MKPGKVICVYIVMAFFSASCTLEQSDARQTTRPDLTDSLELYSFFHDKISALWDYDPGNDSVTFTFDHYGLPSSRSEMKRTGSSVVHFSIRYEYRLSDSTETVRHLQQFGGGHSFTEIRKFGPRGNVVWKEETDVYHNRTKTEYDESGMITNIQRF